MMVWQVEIDQESNHLPPFGAEVGQLESPPLQLHLVPLDSH